MYMRGYKYCRRLATSSTSKEVVDFTAVPYHWFFNIQIGQSLKENKALISTSLGERDNSICHVMHAMQFLFIICFLCYSGNKCPHLQDENDKKKRYYQQENHPPTHVTRLYTTARFVRPSHHMLWPFFSFVSDEREGR